MTLQTNQRGQVLIILLGVLFLGGATLAAGVFGTGKSLGDVGKAVKKQVADENRRDAAREVISRWSSDVDGFLKQTGHRQKTMTKLMRRHDATRPELTAVISEQALASDEIDRRALDYRFALKEQLTREEWGRVFAVEH
jgi:hypothetical protein